MIIHCCFSYTSLNVWTYLKEFKNLDHQIHFESLNDFEDKLCLKKKVFFRKRKKRKEIKSPKYISILIFYSQDASHAFG